VSGHTHERIHCDALGCTEATPFCEDPPDGWVVLQVARQAECPVGIDMAFCPGCQGKVIAALQQLAGPAVLSFDQLALMVVASNLRRPARNAS
jgi:hypothetical protein